MLTQKQAIKRIKDEYPNGIDLVYVEYNDNLNDDHETIEELATTGYVDSYLENTGWMCDAQYETIDYCIKQLFTDEEQQNIEDDANLRQSIVDAFFELDTSDTVHDLLRNTSRRFFYYDLNFELENCDGFQDVEAQARSIARRLHISYKKHEKALCELTANAGYGGNLVILFAADPLDFLSVNKKPSKYITFESRFSLCIMDRCNGSGHDVELIDEKTKKYIPLAFELKRENLHDDRGASGYSYSYDVCGLCMFDPAYFELSSKKPSGKIISVSINEEAEAFAEQEKKYQKRYDAGGCTAGDMKYTRHRNTEYINNFPCGTKCKDCGTFFID